jgi:hypothetical protein
MKTIRTPKQAHELDFIGGHLAIDFVNTVRIVGGVVTDTLHSDGDVKVVRERAMRALALRSDQRAWTEILHLGRLRKQSEGGGLSVADSRASGRLTR